MPMTVKTSIALARMPAMSMLSGWSFGERGGGKITEYAYNPISIPVPTSPNRLTATFFGSIDRPAHLHPVQSMSKAYKQHHKLSAYQLQLKEIYCIQAEVMHALHKRQGAQYRQLLRLAL